MTPRLLLPLLVLTACAEGASNPPAEQSAQSNRSAVPVARPADAPAYGVNDVIGATPGPCGSTRATAFLGKTYKAEMDLEMMRVSGATAIRRIRPTGEDAGEDGPIVDRRMNVLLNDFGQIIMLDCG
jgi:hypothetical protein